MKHVTIGIIFTVLCAGSIHAATLYTNDGVLSDRLEVERWYINRARFNPEAEADRLGLTNTAVNGHPYYDVCEDTNAPNDFGATTNEWKAWIVSRPPLAPNARLNAAAENHSKDMCESGFFQHPSPTANYYSIGDNGLDRAEAEGYTNTISGYYENIAYGGLASSIGFPPYGRHPTNTHAGLFIDASAPSRGHRQGILNERAREIGLGHCRTNYILEDYWGPGIDAYVTEDWETQDFGRASTNHFFTGTIFEDVNTNAAYEAGEGVSNIAVRLFYDDTEADGYDVSSESGGFAIPVNDIPNGREVTVRMVNLNGASRNVTIPLGFTSCGTFDIGAASMVTVGRFTQPNGITNVGWRNTSPIFSEAIADISFSPLVLQMEAWKGLRIRVQSHDVGPTNDWITFTNITATGTIVTVQDTGQAGRDAPANVRRRWYRFGVVRE